MQKPNTPGEDDRGEISTAGYFSLYIQIYQLTHEHVFSSPPLLKATYMLTAHSEHEECRKCLDPGICRRCCKNYYCDDCFYSQPNCPSCEAPVGRPGDDEGLLGRASIYSVVMGWLALTFFLASVAAMVLFISASESVTPVTVSSYLCNGIFRTCDISFCIETSRDVAIGNMSLDSVYDWKYCTLNSEYKMHGWGCAFDPTLYEDSHYSHGFDYCYDTFQQGTYIFEDNFEAWVQPLDHNTNLMKSAKWESVINGKTSDECGVADPDGEVGGGFRALKFDGILTRQAVTQPLNMSAGGWLEASIFLSPVLYDTHPFPLCASSTSGVIEVSYSVDLGDTWEIIHEVKPWESLEKTTFTLTKLILPEHAWTNQTQFKFDQPTFEASLDHWALDNVRVFRYFSSDWHDNPAFKSNVKKSDEDHGRAACCFDTERCERRMSEKELADQCNHITGFEKGVYSLRGPEFYILLIFAVNIGKFIYVSIMNWYDCSSISQKYPMQRQASQLQDLYHKLLIFTLGIFISRIPSPRNTGAWRRWTT